MSDLVTFLKARLDEDDAEIAKQPDGEGRIEGIGLEASGDTIANQSYLVLDKARALAEVDAKRQRIQHYLDVCRLADPATDQHQAYVLAEGAVRRSLKFDALPYSDYRDEWRP